MDKWNIKITKDPFEVKGQQITAGDIQMGGSKFSADADANAFDRAI